MEQTQHRLNTAAEGGDINGLYKCIREDPHILDNIDNIPFVDTPLHTAASAGRTDFTLEMMNLKPSFGRKLNPDGLSPLHLALQNQHYETVRQLISFDKELIRVKGRESFTALHYVALRNDRVRLPEFLCACPAAIEDRTIRGETAMHIAVKRLNSEASEVLLGWMRRTHRRKILNWMDNEGNTALHIAVSTLQPQIVKLLLDEDYENINAENFEGFTAQDIALRLYCGGAKREIYDLFFDAHVSFGSSLGNNIYSVADFLKSGDGFWEVICGWIFRVRSGLSLENPLASLVLILVSVLEVINGSIFRVRQSRLSFSFSKNVCGGAALISIAMAMTYTIIASFQTGLSLPGGVVDNNHNLPINNATIIATFQTGLSPPGPGRVIDHSHNLPTSNVTITTINPPTSISPINATIFTANTTAYNTFDGGAITFGNILDNSITLACIILSIIIFFTGPPLGSLLNLVCLMMNWGLLFYYILPSFSSGHIFDCLSFCALLACVDSFFVSCFWNDMIYYWLTHRQKKRFQMLQRLFDELN